MPLDLLDRLQRILVFADKVADEIVYEETEILEAWTRPPPPRWSKPGNGELARLAPG